MRRAKTSQAAAAERFNTKPAVGIQYLVDHKLVSNPPFPEEIAHFLRTAPGLDPHMVGEYISKPKVQENEAVLKVCLLLVFLTPSSQPLPSCASCFPFDLYPFGCVIIHHVFFLVEFQWVSLCAVQAYLRTFNFDSLPIDEALRRFMTRLVAE